MQNDRGLLINWGKTKVPALSISLQWDTRRQPGWPLPPSASASGRCVLGGDASARSYRRVAPRVAGGAAALRQAARLAKIFGPGHRQA
eukprot:9486397-Pyramimonas_sp.AAC.1